MQFAQVWHFLQQRWPILLKESKLTFIYLNLCIYYLTYSSINLFVLYLFFCVVYGEILQGFIAGVSLAAGILRRTAPFSSHLFQAIAGMQRLMRKINRQSRQLQSESLELENCFLRPKKKAVFFLTLKPSRKPLACGSDMGAFGSDITTNMRGRHFATPWVCYLNRLCNCEVPVIDLIFGGPDLFLFDLEYTCEFVHCS